MNPVIFNEDENSKQKTTGKIIRDGSPEKETEPSMPSSFEKIKKMDFDWSSVETKGMLKNDYQLQKNLIVAVVTTCFQKSDIESIYDTWGKEVSGIKFFMGTEKALSTLGLEGIPVVQLPQLSNRERMAMGIHEILKHLYNNDLNDYKWFVLVSDETYVNSIGLEELLNKLDPDSDVYLGLPSITTEEPKDIAYCIDGPGIILSRRTLRELVEKLNNCDPRNSSIIRWDAELGKCIKLLTGSNCANGATEVSDTSCCRLYVEIISK